jgi:hypothetical protein
LRELIDYELPKMAQSALAQPLHFDFLNASAIFDDASFLSPASCRDLSDMPFFHTQGEIA